MDETAEETLRMDPTLEWSTKVPRMSEPDLMECIEDWILVKDGGVLTLSQSVDAWAVSCNLVVVFRAALLAQVQLHLFPFLAVKSILVAPLAALEALRQPPSTSGFLFRAAFVRWIRNGDF